MVNSLMTAPNIIELPKIRCTKVQAFNSRDLRIRITKLPATHSFNLLAFNSINLPPKDFNKFQLSHRRVIQMPTLRSFLVLLNCRKLKHLWISTADLRFAKQVNH